MGATVHGVAATRPASTAWVCTQHYHFLSVFLAFWKLWQYVDIVLFFVVETFRALYFLWGKRCVFFFCHFKVCHDITMFSYCSRCTVYSAFLPMRLLSKVIQQLCVGINSCSYCRWFFVFENYNHILISYWVITVIDLQCIRHSFRFHIPLKASITCWHYLTLLHGCLSFDTVPWDFRKTVE